MKSFIEALFRGWAGEDGLIPLHITTFDLPGEDLRLWWFFSGSERISPREGMCDEEVVAFFSGTHRFTKKERDSFDCELYGAAQLFPDGDNLNQ